MQAYLDQAVQVLNEGFAQLQSNPKGLIIALVATVFLRSWGQWFPAAVIATVVHVGIDHFAPILAGQDPLALPALMDAAFWSRTGILLVGYLIVIGIFFFVKRIITTAMGGGGKAKGKH